MHYNQTDMIDLMSSWPTFIVVADSDLFVFHFHDEDDDGHDDDGYRIVIGFGAN